MSTKSLPSSSTTTTRRRAPPPASSSTSSKKRRVLFPHRNKRPTTTPSPTVAMASSSSSPAAARDLHSILQTLSSSSSSTEPAPTLPAPPPPSYMTSFPLLLDTLRTPTSTLQSLTSSQIHPLVSSPTLPSLHRASHTTFLLSGLSTLPSGMTALDAARPWILYWCLTALSILGHDLSSYRESTISTLKAAQNATGGFGGGNGQMSHLAPSYAGVLSLVSVGGGAVGVVDRPAMLGWLWRLRNGDGSFSVAVGGETDVRAVYCALTIISLLRLPTDGGVVGRPGEGLLDGTVEWLARCQTYEGGFGASPNGNEAHGGYAFCALAGLAMLEEPGEWGGRVDLEGLVRWTSERMGSPEGGLSGRTNKLVDGCYSTWVGGCWGFIEAAVEAQKAPKASSIPPKDLLSEEKPAEELEAEMEAEEEDGDYKPLFPRTPLIRYILSACQSPRGGLRDKPGKNADYYHTLYVLIGLSATQYRWRYLPALSASTITSEFPSLEGLSLEEEAEVKKKGERVHRLGFGWVWRDVRGGMGEDGKWREGLEGSEGWPLEREWDGECDEVLPVHPVWNVVDARVEEVRVWGDAVVAAGWPVGA